MAEEQEKGERGRLDQVVWLRQALEDLDRILAVIAEYSTIAADRASFAISDAVHLLSQFPRMAKLQPDGAHRQWPIKWGASAIIIRYRIDADGVVIIMRLNHGREQR